MVINRETIGQVEQDQEIFYVPSSTRPMIVTLVYMGIHIYNTRPYYIFLGPTSDQDLRIGINSSGNHEAIISKSLFTEREEAADKLERRIRFYVSTFNSIWFLENPIVVTRQNRED